jgi:hypothetical protein
MDRMALVQHLVEAEDDVTSAARAIIRHRELILDLERDGHEAGDAKRLLAKFEELLKLHMADRDSCRKLFAK